MSKYLKLFETTSQYKAYINGSDVVLPNVSVAKDAPTTVYFNPYVPPRPTQIITYEASAKLAETTDDYKNGLHPNAFSGKSGKLTMTKHTFENSVGTIEFDGDVTNIGDYAFRECSGITSVTIPDSVTSIGNFVFYCTGLTSITIPDSVTSIGNNAFFGCSGLTCITIPNNVTSIGECAFQSCRQLTSITIPSGVTSIGNSAFFGCPSLTSIVVDSANTVYDSRDNCNAIVNTSTNKLVVGCKNTVIPDTVTSIGDYAFFGCSGLTSITIPNSVTSIGDYAFYYCSSLTSVTSLRKTAPTIGNNTFQNVKTGGTLTVPSGSSGYDVWMSKNSNYLGKYNWTKVEQ